MAALTHPARARRTAGFSLLELLVAVTIVAVGALGIARLQLHSAQNGRAAAQRTVAALLAEDMLERMRANPAGVYAAAVGDAPPAYVDCLGGRCDAAQLTAFDIAVWKCSLGGWPNAPACQQVRAAGLLDAAPRQAALPGGDGSVETGADGIVTVTVAWRHAGPRSLRLGGMR